ILEGGGDRVGAVGDLLGAGIDGRSDAAGMGVQRVAEHADAVLDAGIELGGAVVECALHGRSLLFEAESEAVR
ncbi:hypothetical protein HMPREF0496_1508, partial [Lentilactobacillus hilgardii ATCC 27305]